jgi:hypothetical protein
MNYIRAYSIKTYENKISHDYYCQIVTHEICDVDELSFLLDVFCDMLHLTKILSIQNISTNMNKKKLDSKWINR